MDERAKFEEWFYFQLGQREKISLIESGIYSEAMNVAWLAWQAAQAAPKPSECRALVPVHTELADGPEDDLHPLTPWQFVCMLILLAGDVARLGSEVLCAFALDPVYCIRWLVVMSKRRLRQAGFALADAMA